MNESIAGAPTGAIHRLFNHAGLRRFLSSLPRRGLRFPQELIGTLLQDSEHTTEPDELGGQPLGFARRGAVADGRAQSGRGGHSAHIAAHRRAGLVLDEPGCDRDLLPVDDAQRVILAHALVKYSCSS